MNLAGRWRDQIEILARRARSGTTREAAGFRAWLGQTVPGQAAARTRARVRATGPCLSAAQKPRPWPNGNSTPVPSARGIDTGSLPVGFTSPKSTRTSDSIWCVV